MPHIHDQIDFTAEVFIVFRNRVLLRKHDKYKIWLSIGGHIELDEDPIQAVIREAKEEVGLDITLLGEPIRVADEGQNGYHELLPPRFMNRHHINDHHDHVTFIYFGMTETDAINNQADEHSDEMHWFTENELDDPTFGIRDSVRQYAHAALHAVRG